GNRSENDVRTELRQLLVTEAELLHDARREVLDHDVATRDELAGDLDCLGAAKIEEDTLLSLVPLVEVAGSVRARLDVVRKDRQPAAEVDSCIRFDAND